MPSEAEFDDDLPVARSITVARAAQVLDCDPTMIRKLLARGELQGHRLGNRGVRILVDSIGAYQRRNMITPTVGPATRRAPNMLTRKAAKKRLRELGYL